VLAERRQPAALLALLVRHRDGGYTARCVHSCRRHHRSHNPTAACRRHRRSHYRGQFLLPIALEDELPHNIVDD
jgi:hypothetical protein